MKNFLKKRDAGDLHRLVVRVLLFLMVIEWIVLMVELRFLQLFLVTVIIIVLLAPELFRNKMDIVIPAEFHFVAVIFILASLYLGEIQQFYRLIWWWDMALHTTSGFLLGIVGFLLVHIMNETEKIHVQMKPGFVAFFAFMFSLGVGALWEIFEFTMDSVFGVTMQKPMLGDPSGLTDTMWDLIVDATGALVIAVLGWRYLKNPDQRSFLERWIDSFIERNPRFFKK